MALKAADQVYTQEGNTALELEAHANESFLIKDVLIYDPASNYVTLRVTEGEVGFFAGGASIGNHLAFDPQNEEHKTLLKFLWDEGIFKGYPVPTGQKFSIIGAAQAGAIQVVIYDIYEAGDITHDMDEGAFSTKWSRVVYGQSGTNPLADGDNEYTESLMESGFHDFPFGQRVPAGKVYRLLGILFGDYSEDDNAGNSQITEYIRFMKGKNVVFDETRNGLLYMGSAPAAGVTERGMHQSLGGWYSNDDRRLPFMLTEPIEFTENEELTVYCHTSVEANNALIVPDSVDMGLIFEIEVV